MNGPEHYAEAERPLAEAADPNRYLVGLDLDGLSAEHVDRILTTTRTDVVFAGDGVQIVDYRVAAAQVHATLALAAATAADRLAGPVEPWGGTTTSVRDSYDWEQATR